MNIIEKLKAKTLDLRKARHHLGPIMQFHIAEITKIGKSKNRETSEDEVIQYLKKTTQRLSEDKYSDLQELDILENLLPKMATVDEVQDYLFRLGADGGIDMSNKGAVMKAVKAEFGALVDMKMIGEML